MVRPGKGLSTVLPVADVLLGWIIGHDRGGGDLELVLSDRVWRKIQCDRCQKGLKDEKGARRCKCLSPTRNMGSTVGLVIGVDNGAKQGHAPDKGAHQVV